MELNKFAGDLKIWLSFA